MDPVVQLQSAERPGYVGVERRQGDRRGGADRRQASRRHAGTDPVVLSPAGGKSGIRGSACRGCAFAHPRSFERGGVRLCRRPDVPSSIVLGDQHACAHFSPATL